MNLEKLAPDVTDTIKRFPFPTFLIGLATLILIGLINEFLQDSDETMIRFQIGVATAAIFALAGTLYAESRNSAPHSLRSAILIYLVPILVIAAMQVRSFEWIMPAPLVAVGIFWLSVSAFTNIGQGTARAEIQNVFWWLNHRAVATAVLAFAGFCIISLGLFAIERSLSLLFGMRGDRLFYSYLLPFTGMFLTPLYWFSTIPKLGDYRAEELTEPDFLSRAIGFLGQFVLVPLLLAYSAILLAYAVQIVVNGSLPEGTIGWMVLGYLVTGAATWLVLHPPFMREKQIVKLFQRFWFWLTIIPLGLYATAVFIRVDAYGLTSERILLVAGGIWAALLTASFLLKRFADIRLIPALAGFLFLLLALGPWNIDNLAVLNQFSRLNNALAAAGWGIGDNTSEWSPNTARTARSAYAYLRRHDTAEQKLKDFFLTRGVTEEQWTESDTYDPAFLSLPKDGTDDRKNVVYLGRAHNAGPVLLLNSNIYLGDISANKGSIATYGNLTVTIDDNHFIINRDGVEVTRTDLLDWFQTQGPNTELITKPLLRLGSDQGTFALIVTYANFEESDGKLTATHLTAMLFADQLP